MRKFRAERIISFILTMAMIAGILPVGVLNVEAAETNTFADPALISLTDEPIELNLLSADELPPDDDLSGADIAEISEESQEENEVDAEIAEIDKKLEIARTSDLIESMSITLFSASDFTYTQANGNATITGYTGDGGEITIPELIDGFPVTAIRYGCGSNELKSGKRVSKKPKIYDNGND